MLFIFDAHMLLEDIFWFCIFAVPQSKALEYLKKAADVIKQLCSPENYAHKYDLRKFPAVGNLLNWPPDLRKDDMRALYSHKIKNIGGR